MTLDVESTKKLKNKTLAFYLLSDLENTTSGLISDPGFSTQDYEYDTLSCFKKMNCDEIIEKSHIIQQNFDFLKKENDIILLLLGRKRIIDSNDGEKITNLNDDELNRLNLEAFDETQSEKLVPIILKQCESFPNKEPVEIINDSISLLEKDLHQFEK